MTETTFSPAAAPLADRLLEQAREIMARYPEGRERSALLPLLHLVQTVEGQVSPAGVAFCAEVLGINKAQVGAVATFYTMYKRRPTGDWLVSVCTNTMCNVLGGQEVYDTLSELLGVGHDETTADGTITLEHAECLAACDYGPVMTVNYEFFDRVDSDSATQVVEQLRAGERPMPTRGARLCTLKEMSLQLAGFADPRDNAVGDGPAGDSTLRGVRLAQEHGIAVPGFNPETPIPRKDGAAAPPAAAKPAVAAKPVAAKTATKSAATKSTAAKPAAKAGPAAETEPAAEAKPAEKGKSAEPGKVAAAAKKAAGAVKAATTRRTAKSSAAEAAEAAGVAANKPASDAKPAGDESGQAQAENLSDAAKGVKRARPAAKGAAAKGDAAAGPAASEEESAK